MRAADRRSRGGARTRAHRPALRRDEPRATGHGELILVATDDAEVRHTVCDELDGQGYRAVTASLSTDIDELAAQIQPGAILLDLDRTEGHPLAVVTRIREHSAIPVIALSVREAEGDKVAALDAGADDYVTKPFGTRELLARIRVALRYAPPRPAGGERFEVGPIQIDAARHAVTVAGKPVHLTPIAFRVLAVLARSRGAVVSRERMLDEIWGPGADQHDHLRVQIAALRRKIEDDPGRPRWLVTVVGIGYRLSA